MEPKNQYTQKILAPVRRVSVGDTMLWGVLIALVLAGGAAWVWQMIDGLGITGMNRPVYWGVYITNFVFFIGLAHSGTFISAILRIAGQSWRAPLTRAAEAITLFSLPFGAGSIIIDMGHPERLFNLLFFGRYQSPIMWDVTAVSLYMLSSIVFFYLSLLPDIAMCRDRLTDVPRWQHRMYEILALGWNHSPEQYHRLEKVLDGMAVFMTMLVVTVHTVVSWLFGMTVQPGWHTALIGPFFLLGAILSGTAAVVIVLALLRKVYKLEKVLHIGLFNSLRKLLITFVLGWLYMMIAEHLTIGYSSMTEEMVVLTDKFSGTLCAHLLEHGGAGVCRPAADFPLQRQKSHWLDGVRLRADQHRYVDGTLHRHHPDRSQPAHVACDGAGPVTCPALPEILITVACFAGLFLLYAVFTRFFPIVPIWETAQELPGHAHATEVSPAVSRDRRLTWILAA